MRKIKFRAKMTGFQGNVFGTPGNVYQDKDYKHEWFDSIFFQDENGNKCQEYIDCHTLSEFTGLTDKNGIEIYENDILKSELGWIFAVKWDNENARFIGSNNKNQLIYVGREPKATVIGNIFDNPELLR